jgi:hypothetical protein
MAWDRQLAARLGRTCTWFREHLDFKVAAPGTPEPSRTGITEGGVGPQSITVLRDDGMGAGSHVCVLGYPRSVVVAFQGTISELGSDGKLRFDSLKDWLGQLRIELMGSKETGLPGRVQEEYYRELAAIAPQLKTELQGALSARPGASLHVTGHSRGGALAAIATKWLELQGLPPAATYTFGAPRPGDTKLAASVCTPVYRLEYGDDIVPHVPPRTAVSGVIGGLTKVGGFLAAAPYNELLVRLGELAARAQKIPHAGIGVLVYRDQGGAIRPGLHGSEEEALAGQRAKALLQAGKDLVEHHHMPHYLAMLAP